MVVYSLQVARAVYMYMLHSLPTKKGEDRALHILPKFSTHILTVCSTDIVCIVEIPNIWSQSCP